MAAGTGDVFAELLVMLHPHAARGTAPDGWATGDALNVWQAHGLAPLQDLQVLVGTAVVVAAVESGGTTLPLPPTLPAEQEILLPIGGAYGAQDAQVGGILSLHVCIALRATLNFTVVCGSQTSHGVFKVLHFLNGQISQPAHFLVRPRFVAQFCPLNQRWASKLVVPLIQLAATPPR